jgi:hypothetical protein
MATIAAKTRRPFRCIGTGPWRHAAAKVIAALLVATVALTLSVRPAAADTGGGANILGTALPNVFNTPYPFNFDPTNPTPVDLRNCSYSFIYNDYLGFTVGMTGSYSQRVNQDTTISVTVPGRISFGNLKGSLRPEAAMTTPA